MGSLASGQFVPGYNVRFNLQVSRAQRHKRRKNGTESEHEEMHYTSYMQHAISCNVLSNAAASPIAASEIVPATVALRRALSSKQQYEERLSQPVALATTLAVPQLEMHRFAV